MPYHGGGLEHQLLIGRQAVDTRSEDGLQGGRHQDRGHGLSQSVGAALTSQALRLDQRAHVLLDEEWIPPCRFDQEMLVEA